MITLAIDTSSTRGSVAVVEENGPVLFSEQFTADRTHSSLLFACLERALKVAPRCARLAVGLGPGSYSGVRIALSAALGMQLGMGAALCGIPSIVALETVEPEYQVIGDARRGTFYFARVRAGKCGEGPLLLTAEELRGRLAASSLPVFAIEPVPEFPEAALCRPSAEKLARLAEQGHGTGDADRPLEPIYLREPHITQPRRDK